MYMYVCAGLVSSDNDVDSDDGLLKLALPIRNGSVDSQLSSQLHTRAPVYSEREIS